MKSSQTGPSGKEITPKLRNVLMAIGRGLGTVSVYGTDHPSVDQIVDQSYESLHETLKSRSSVTIGSFNGVLTVDDEPVTVRDIPIRTLETRLVTMKVSHLVLHAGLSKDELKQLLVALCSPSDSKMKEALSGSGLEHIELEDVKYVTLRSGERKTGKGDGDGGGLEEIPPAQITQIVAFLKGKSSDTDSAEGLKKALSDPEKLGQIIMEAAAIRQTGVDVHDGESLAGIVIGCLRRTYSGLRKENEFQSVQGKANLTKAMMLLEKTVLDKIHKALGTRHPEIDKRIFDAIREMEEEQQFDVLTSHYFAQNKKLKNVENQVVNAIQKYGFEKAKQQFKEAGIPPKDWQRLMVEAGESPTSGGGLPGADMSVLAVVLEKLETLMQVDNHTSEQIKTAVTSTKNGMETYTDGIESRIRELEGQVDLGRHKSITIEDHAGHLSREELMLEVSNLMLALVQPLTVVNASIEAAQPHVKEDLPKEMLNLAHLSGKRMQTLADRMMKLVGYPLLGE